MLQNQLIQAMPASCMPVIGREVLRPACPGMIVAQAISGALAVVMRHCLDVYGWAISGLLAQLFSGDPGPNAVWHSTLLQRGRPRKASQDPSLRTSWRDVGTFSMQLLAC